MKKKPFKTVSASSITTFLDCPRKWWLRYILGERPDPSPAMEHGTEVHDDIEGYLIGKQDDLQMPEGIEADAQGMIPAPGEVEDYLVEYDASDLDLRIDGLRFLGYLDLVQVDQGEVSITDWKTRGGFSYVPDSRELHDDYQARLYAWASFHLADQLGLDVDSIDFRHGNMLRVDGKRGRNSPKSREVWTEFDRTEIFDWIDDTVVKIVRKMKSVAIKNNARRVEQNKDNCYKYGPCEYMDPIGALRGRSCHDIEYEPQQSSSDQQKGEHMSMMDLINKKNDDNESQEEKAPEPEPQEAEKSEEAGEPGSALADAKADYRADRQEFDLRDYDLNHNQKREFVQWRKDLLKEATETQKESDIPPVNPPDAAPDEDPLDLADQVIGDFDFTDVSGVGEKTAENIRQKIADDGIEDLIELVDYDLTKISGIGSKGAKSLEAAIKAEKNWTPDGEDEGGAYDQDRVYDQAVSAIKSGDDDALAKAKARATGQTATRIETAEVRHATTDITGDGDPEPKTPESGQPVETGSQGPHGDDQITESVETGKPVVERKGVNTQAPAGDSEPSILYIDCLPTKGPRPTPIEELLEPYKQAIAEDEGIAYWNANGFGKARKWLTVAVLQEPEPFEKARAVFARERDQGMDHLLPEIRQFFDIVVEG